MKALWLAALIGVLLTGQSTASTLPGRLSGTATDCPKGYYFIPPCPLGKQCAWRGNVCMKYPTSPDHWPRTRRPGSKPWTAPAGNTVPDSKHRADSPTDPSTLDGGIPTGSGPSPEDQPGPTMPGEMKHCITTEIHRGRNCGNPNSLQVIFQNHCATTVSLKYCLERTDGRWNCGAVSRFDEGDTTQGAWICSATGKYKWSASDLP